MKMKLVLENCELIMSSHDLFSSKVLQVWVKQHSVSNSATSGLRDKF